MSPMFDLAKAMVQTLCVQFNAGNFARVAESFVYPLPVQVENDLIVLNSAGEMAASLSAYHAQNVAQGLAPSHAQVLAIDLPRNGRFRLWVDWVYQPDAGPEHARTKNLYYCSAIGNRIQIEMIQYLRVAAKGPVIQTAYAERLLSA
jgi:hypothetical protein